jgi:hypothetical protein
VNTQHKVGRNSACTEQILIYSRYKFKRLYKYDAIFNFSIQIMLKVPRMLNVLHDFHVSIMTTSTENKYCPKSVIFFKP